MYTICTLSVYNVHISSHDHTVTGVADASPCTPPEGRARPVPRQSGGGSSRLAPSPSATPASALESWSPSAQGWVWPVPLPQHLDIHQETHDMTTTIIKACKCTCTCTVPDKKIKYLWSGLVAIPTLLVARFGFGMLESTVWCGLVQFGAVWSTYILWGCLHCIIHLKGPWTFVQ